ncbi:sensor histidine kinase [Deinococcus petrolearius]|uniref:histidine kinase n=1 Tax=Deinococcus petrolearius TaxID=1751295 RepID=A0ABW1DEU6_9DEIO
MNQPPAPQVPGKPGGVPDSRRAPPLAAMLLLAMLAVVGLALGSTFFFSNLAVEREFRRLPPEVQSYLRAQQAAQRQGQVLTPTPPVPEIRTGSPADPYLPPGWSSPGVFGETVTAAGRVTVVEDGARVRRAQASGPGGTDADAQGAGGSVGGRRWVPPDVPRSQDFLRNIQASLVQVGLVAALASAALAFWLSRRLARPITAVSQAARRLAQGDLAVRAPWPPSGSQMPWASGEREIIDLARSFNEMAEGLQALERERQQAVADIAHELRTPIAVMQARLDALEDGVYPLNTDQIALLSTQTQLLTRLVGDLRTLTLADAGRLALKLRDTELGHLAAEVVGGLQDQAARQGVQLDVLAPSAPLRADPDRVRQVVTNLVENALRHARAQVRVQVEPGEGAVTLLVDDDGSGIPVGSREAVFTRFTRLDESRARDTGGSGLGLAIVQALAQAHGGAARAEESPLGGARLSVTFPYAQSLPAQPLPAAAGA